ncbi:STAS domain-containing protein [Catellatospora sichuanensis]|uniref:STAS domain-containing protein n=1 Tax=Catellatospora sichuanensis TaxID=1969805 RepID=UPI001643217F|nr:STAS domain-containing protein [Catellatospora sichuanensis]
MSRTLRMRLYSGPIGLYLIAEGALDTTSVHQLTRAVDLAMNRLNPARFTIDVGGLDFIDVAGVATLIACRRDADARGVTLRVVQASAQVRATVDACEAADLLACADGDRLPSAGPRRHRSHRPGPGCLRPTRRSRRNQPSR